MSPQTATDLPRQLVRDMARRTAGRTTRLGNAHYTWKLPPPQHKEMDRIGDAGESVAWGENSEDAPGRHDTAHLHFCL